jgi:hypothetical protein
MPRGIAGSKADSVWVATETFACEIDGVGVVVHAGETRVREGHPMLDTYRTSFKLADQGVHFEVEQATAAPGEKRGSPKSDEPKSKGGPITTDDAKKAN